jgi:putative SOS response-associated peptidase YedK
MCGRYTLFSSLADICKAFGITLSEKQEMHPPHQPYNIGPMMNVPIIIGERVGMAKWGYIPRWVSNQINGIEKPNEMAVKLKNARSETVFEKPMFRDSWNTPRRCLIPMNGFYEWQKTGQQAGPHMVSRAPNHEQLIDQHPLFCMAGLWDIWPKEMNASSDQKNIGFTVLTKSARPALSDVHHREPVMFSPEIGKKWLQADNTTAQKMMTSDTIQDLHEWRVKSDVGNIKNNDPALFEPDHHLALLF